KAAEPARSAPPVSPVFEDQSGLLAHSHTEAVFEDFERQPLQSKRLSQLGPGVGWWDLDGDGWEDLLIGSGKGGVLAWYRNDHQGGFKRASPPAWSPELRDQTAVVGWGPGAVLVGSANYEDGQTNGSALQCFGGAPAQVVELLGAESSSVGPVAVADYDGDGSLDVFVGGRVRPGRYPLGAGSVLYRQQQGGKLVRDEANTPQLAKAGLVSGAVWSDLDGDGWPELVLACEWGPVRVFHNGRGVLREVTKELGLAELTGWWNGVCAGDLDGDGRLDLIASNWGRNTKYQASKKRPAKMYYGDFDQDGTLDTVECRIDEASGREVPERDLESISAGLGFVRGRFPTHAQYARASVSDILGDNIKSARKLEANTLDSMVFLNRTNRFEAVALPREAQFATSFAVCVGDYNGDGLEDVFLSQNFFATDKKTPRCDAGRGLWLQGNGKGGLEAVPGQNSGVAVYGEQRGAALCDYDQDGRVDLVVTQNGAPTRLFHNIKGRPGLRIRLAGPATNPLGIGAVLRIVSGGHWGPARETHAGSGYWSQDSTVQVMATPSNPTALWVRWPGGRVTTTQIPEGAKEIAVDAEGKLVSSK
ncbi:MAG TPA: VCBS repeat-containing protein, partial [Clostridia bacterium]|nr:VCBS repeat-containing protein [Clostridia bacterium]